ncbi:MULTISPECIES: tripartite tricarboxylate transporter TctB family protein [Massilia]|uniref:Small permease of tripartite tricarboxylate transporter n=2 Tax=Massilia TaxID=149698 RepID=A0A422QGR4_9BURK|nr:MULTISPECIES: tripartite tricarboxylate transporter TctB family protein [Massilia]MDY0961236.1 tripartite tricarboxylate transporter TctB family protein [Massilia sp. CFBP9026]MDY0975500.1 tripartite tricarboxylate transporter TctB family protein [Massilia sp. CFBP9012]RNF29139.1 small permease of tripartite tricarboxylate transporter [Massilia aurea]TXF99053.1 tripartite tricarboxylate transporter TctB family protein [Massilia arenae]
MPAFIRHPKDFWSGIVFLLFGLSAIVIGQDYEMGTAGRMGPAYFPSVLGGLLSLVGAASLIRSFFREGEPIGRLYWRELALVLVAVLLFGFLVRDAGLIPATLVLIMISSYAGQKFNLAKAIALAIGAALFAVGLFVKLLGLPMPMFGPWFGGA